MVDQDAKTREARLIAESESRLRAERGPERAPEEKRLEAQAREQRYLAVEERVRTSLDGGIAREALGALARCPRRSGIRPLGEYYCECPACDPGLWFGDPEQGLGN